MTAPSRRLAAVLAVAAVCVALPFARTTAAPDRPLATASFSAMGLSFRYPAAWQIANWHSEMPSFNALIVYLSTSRHPCAVTTRLGDVSVLCPDRQAQLPPGGVLVTWEADGFPGWGLTPLPNATIGGRPAIETRNNDDAWCTSLGGTETITALILRDGYQMNACLRAPDLPQQEAQISAMLATVHITQGKLCGMSRESHESSSVANNVLGVGA